jgi:hypothetical protein
MGCYDVSQICLNGHTITRHANSSPQFLQKHCDKCGEATITNCPDCDTPIRGEYETEAVAFIVFCMPPAPHFCHECGHPYPWTVRKLIPAKELSDELDELSKDEIHRLKSSLDDLLVDNPRTEFAATRFKKIMSKVREESYEMMKAVVGDVMSEAARKTVFGK